MDLLCGADAWNRETGVSNEKTLIFECRTHPIQSTSPTASLKFWKMRNDNEKNYLMADMLLALRRIWQMTISTRTST